jgi:photosystem II stability/assembly factor-like uncharacterized protein
MKLNRNLILVLALALTAASCNLLGGGSGAKGILKSEDAGQNFQATNKLQPKGDIDGLSVNNLSFDANNRDIIYLSAASGIYKTEDAGATWRQILTGISVYDVVTDPNATDVVYAAGLAGRNGKIIRSADGGSTWTDLYTEPSRSTAVSSITVSKVNSKLLLAGLASGEIIRSMDQGQTWQAVTDLQDAMVRIRFYDTSTVYAVTLTKGVAKSTDQGTNWTSLSTPQIQIPTTGSSSIRRYLDVSFDQKLKGVIFVSTDQGVIRTVDDGATWSVMYLPVRNTTLISTAVAVSPLDSNTLYAAVGSTVFKSTNGGVSWETNKLPTGQTVRQILINPETPNVIYLGMGDKK